MSYPEDARPTEVNQNGEWGRLPPTRRRRTPALIAAVLALAVIAVTVFLLTRPAESANSGETLVDSGGEISNAASFLADLDETWLGGTARLTAQQANVSADARCYYLLDSTGATTAKAACGPLRRFGTEAGMVWDIYTLAKSIDFTGDQDKTTWTFDAASPALTGSTRPTGTFYRPDGTQPPPEADALEAPPVPVAPPNLLVPYNLAANTTINNVTIDPSVSTLIAPGLQMRLTQVGEVDTVAEADFATTSAVEIPDQHYQAGDGRKLLAFTVEVDFGWSAPEAEVADAGERGYSSAVAPPPAISFISDGVRTDISQWFDPENTREVQTRTFLANIAAAQDASVQLAIAVSGHEQRMAVGSAERVADPITDIYYNASRVNTLNATMPSFPIEYEYYGAQSLSYSATVSSVVFSPYDPRRGWAPKGQRWVSAIATDNFDQIGYSPGTIALDYSAWKIIADGTEYPAEYQNLEGNSDGVFVFLVPDTVTSVEGSFVTVATVTLGDKDPLVFTSSALTFTASLS